MTQGTFRLGPKPGRLERLMDDIAINGLEWLGYLCPAATSPTIAPAIMWSATEQSLIDIANGHSFRVDIDGDTAMLNDTTGVGMGRLSRALSPLECAVLDHVLKGHCSLRRQFETRKHSKGGLPVTLAGLWLSMSPSAPGGGGGGGASSGSKLCDSPGSRSIW